MHLDLRPFLYLWLALAGIVAVLFGWRQSLARKEDETLQHVLQGNTSGQQVLIHRLEQIEKWGKLLTIVAVVYGVVLGTLYIYQAISSPGLSGM